MGYLGANFGLPRPLCSELRPDVGLLDRQTDRQTDKRQTDVRRASSISAPPMGH